jgi:hypothetical protein
VKRPGFGQTSTATAGGIDHVRIIQQNKTNRRERKEAEKNEYIDSYSKCRPNALDNALAVITAVQMGRYGTRSGAARNSLILFSHCCSLTPIGGHPHPVFSALSTEHSLCSLVTAYWRAAPPSLACLTAALVCLPSLWNFLRRLSPPLPLHILYLVHHCEYRCTRPASSPSEADSTVATRIHFPSLTSRKLPPSLPRFFHVV